MDLSHSIQLETPKQVIKVLVEVILSPKLSGIFTFEKSISLVGFVLFNEFFDFISKDHLTGLVYESLNQLFFKENDHEVKKR